MRQTPTSRWNFRPLQLEDMELFQQWVHSDHVYEWWYEDALALDDLIELYRPDIEGTGTAHCFIVERNDQPFGYIQWYRIGDEPDWTPPAIRIDPRDVAVDLFVGDPNGVDRGLGSEMLRTFLRDVVFPAAADANYCWIDPDPENKRAVRANVKAGFRPVALVDRIVEGKPDRALVLCLPREALLSDR